MKCSRDLNKSLHQQTLAESWFSNNKHVAERLKTPRKTRLKSPAKTSLKNFTTSRITRSSSRTPGNDQIKDEENISDDDNKIVESSQGNNESKLRKRINEKLSNKIKAPQQTPQKADNVYSPNLINNSLIGNFDDVCSGAIPEELYEMFDNIVDCKPIQIAHDLSSIVTDTRFSSNILEYSTSQNSHTIDMESIIKDEESSRDEELHDPLYIEEKVDDTDYKITNSKKRKRKSSQSKNTSISICSKCKQSFIEDNSHERSRKRHKSKTQHPEDSTLSKEQEKVLKSLRIQLQHKVPPQHEIENNAGSRTLNKEQILEFENYGPLKRGLFTQSEDETIKKNWEDFCYIHNWDPEIVEPFMKMRHFGKFYIPKLEQRKNFVKFLANGLPWRSLYSVYFRFRNLYVSAGVGKYTPKEDKLILSHMKNASTTGIINKCAEIANILNRKRHSVWQHYQKLKRSHNLDISTDKSSESDSEDNSEDDSDSKKVKRRKSMKKNSKNLPKVKVNETVYSNVKWTCPLVKKFIDSLMEVTNSTELQDLKNQIFDQNVWNKMEKKTHINCKVLSNFWYYQLHMQLFYPRPTYMNDLKIDLIEYIYDKQLKHVEDIKWESVSSDFDGITPFFLSKLFKHLMLHAETKVDSSELSDIMEYLYKNHILDLEEKSEDLILPKIYYKDEKIYFDKGTENRILNKTATNHPFSDNDD